MRQKPVIGICEICGRPATCRDHDHVTGMIRGLLCVSCNAGVGMLRDDPVLADRAAIYLRRPADGPMYKRMPRYDDGTGPARSAVYRLRHRAQINAYKRRRRADGLVG